MPKSRTRKKKPAAHSIIYVPDGLAKLLGEEFLKRLQQRIDRKVGVCASCGKKLGRRDDLALVAQMQEGDALGVGDWMIATTHRSCHRETLQVVGMMRLTPKQTYRSLLLALPVALPDTDEFARIPVMCVNPSVDHFAVTVTGKGQAHDRFQQFLEDTAEFAQMGDDLSDLGDNFTGDLTAYIRGADATVAASDAGISWSHENTSLDPQTRAAISADLQGLLEQWGALMVLVSDRFNFTDPNALVTQLPDLFRGGHVLGALAKPEFQADVADLISKAQQAGPFHHPETPCTDPEVSAPAATTPAAPHGGRET